MTPPHRQGLAHIDELQPENSTASSSAALFADWSPAGTVEGCRTGCVSTTPPHRQGNAHCDELQPKASTTYCSASTCADWSPTGAVEGSRTECVSLTPPHRQGPGCLGEAQSDTSTTKLGGNYLLRTLGKLGDSRSPRSRSPQPLGVKWLDSEGELAQGSVPKGPAEVCVSGDGGGISVPAHAHPPPLQLRGPAWQRLRSGDFSVTETLPGMRRNTCTERVRQSCRGYALCGLE